MEESLLVTDTLKPMNSLQTLKIFFSAENEIIDLDTALVGLLLYAG